jgi:hypothetical protein
MIDEDDLVEQLCFNFGGDLCERIKYVKIFSKGDFDGDDDGLFWHFTHFSVIQHMLQGRQLWLSDLSFSNDADEIVYGLNRAGAIVEEVSAQWDKRNGNITQIVRRIAQEAIRKFSSTFHAYAFCLSDERDTVQHWNEYGGGLRAIPASDDPPVAVGFTGESFFHPLKLSSKSPPIYLINTVSGDEAVDHLIQYWTLKARSALQVLDKRKGQVSARKIYSLFRHMLILACALGKTDGWRDEHEYRLLYITPNFGEEHTRLPQKPNGRGRYVPLEWMPDRLPIRALTPHPLADLTAVRKELQLLSGGERIEIIPSKLNPRPR